MGYLGFVVYDSRSRRFYHGHGPVPQHILDFFVVKKQKIGQCEIAAAIAVYASLPDLARGRDVIHWIDNTSAISCLLHGYSGKPDSARLVNAFHLFNAALRANIHFEYVESKSNVADLPSRRELTYLLLQLASRPVPLRVLDASTWAGPLRGFLDAAEPGLSDRIRRKRKRHRPRASSAVSA